MGVYSDTPTAYLRHEGLDAGAVVSDLDGVVEAYEARGWVRVDALPAHLDPDAPDVGVPVQPDLAEEPAEAEAETPEPAKKTRGRKAEPEAESATTTTPEGDEVNG